MGNIVIFKATHYVDDSIHLANMTQKLISQTFARTGALDQTSNIYHLKAGGNNGG